LSLKKAEISHSLNGKAFTTFARVLWIASGALSLALLLQIDRIVHQDLYNYGLMFSYNWAAPYWTAFRLAAAFILIPMALSAVQLTANLMAWLRAKRENINAEVGQSVAVKNAKNRRVECACRQGEHEKCQGEQDIGGGMSMKCDKCNKTFTRPLVMLDFRGEEAKLVNLCPYCNAKLDELDDNENAEAVDYYVKDDQEKLVEGK